MTAIGYLALAYAFVWVGLGLYLLYLGRRLERVREELDELRRELNDERKV